LSGSPVSRDARKHARAALELPVVVSDPAGRASGGIRFDSAAVATGGAFLRSDLLFEVGERLTLQFQLPQGGPTVRIGGRVTRVSRGQSREVPGMGVEFIDLRPEDRAAIEERLRR
jgi:hypothetical protein